MNEKNAQVGELLRTILTLPGTLAGKLYESLMSEQIGLNRVWRPISDLPQSKIMSIANKIMADYRESPDKLRRLLSSYVTNIDVLRKADLPELAKTVATVRASQATHEARRDFYELLANMLTYGALAGYGLHKFTSKATPDYEVLYSKIPQLERELMELSRKKSNEKGTKKASAEVTQTIFTPEDIERPFPALVSLAGEPGGLMSLPLLTLLPILALAKIYAKAEKKSDQIVAERAKKIRDEYKKQFEKFYKEGSIKDYPNVSALLNLLNQRYFVKRATIGEFLRKYVGDPYVGTAGLLLAISAIVAYHKAKKDWEEEYWKSTFGSVSPYEEMKKLRDKARELTKDYPVDSSFSIKASGLAQRGFLKTAESAASPSPNTDTPQEQGSLDLSGIGNMALSFLTNMLTSALGGIGQQGPMAIQQPQQQEPADKGILQHINTALGNLGKALLEKGREQLPALAQRLPSNEEVMAFGGRSPFTRG